MPPELAPPEEAQSSHPNGVGGLPLKVCIVGQPNSGKSSLLNRLLGDPNPDPDPNPNPDPNPDPDPNPNPTPTPNPNPNLCRMKEKHEKSEKLVSDPGPVT